MDIIKKTIETLVKGGLKRKRGVVRVSFLGGVLDIKNLIKKL